ncbi:hypothetical protein FRC03_012739 [Tulasnella sp. 419]|nr:hypothetical protein FRC03_012739 [Tulasnella sp. 419]
MTSNSVDPDYKFPPSPQGSTVNLPTSFSPPSYSPPQPSLRLLFSYLTRRDVYTCLLPAMSVSIIAGGIAPFMTRVIGQIFDAMAVFSTSKEEPRVAQERLRRDCGIAAIQLLALSAGILFMSSIMANLWMWVGERNALRLRKRVYYSVTHRELEWFDTKMGTSDGKDQSAEGDKEGAGAGGMMAKFTRDTDDVRLATSLNIGMLLQYSVTFIACLVLALVQSWSLTLVILSSIPLMVIVQGFSQGLAVPLYDQERSKTAQSGTYIERTVVNIATVKAFNAMGRETKSFESVINLARLAYRKCCIVWGVSSGMTQFILFAMFVQGFWYGSKLVRDGKITPGEVMGVFWACLIASSNLQLCIPLLVVLTKGKAAMVSLDVLINQDVKPSTHNRPTSAAISEARPQSTSSAANLITPTSSRSLTFYNLSQNKLTGMHSQEMMKIRPTGKTHGSFSIHNLSFHYPSRPSVKVLDLDEIYLPSGETTFVVGGSGSGKSTIAQLLLRLYHPQLGTILFDDQDLSHLDLAYTREHVAAVSQSVILFDMTVHDNVAMGVAGSGKRRPEDVSREEVIKACTAALMDGFVKELPDGYDTRLGMGGASLSGGQRQRLAIARAMIRDPTVLILDEATSALDANSRVLVFEAIKAWRRNRTTIVITHDLSQITQEDFVYVMKNGSIVDHGFRGNLEQKEGEFRSMLEKQMGEGGFPVKTLDDVTSEDDANPDGWVEVEDEGDEEDGWTESSGGSDSKATRHASAAWKLLKHSSQLVAGGASRWMFDAIADLTNDKPSEDVRSAAAARASRYQANDAFLGIPTPSGPMSVGRTSYQAPKRPSLAYIPPDQLAQRRNSMQFEPVSPPPVKTGWSEFELQRAGGMEGGPRRRSVFVPADEIEVDDEFEKEKDAMKASADAAGKRRPGLDRGPSSRKKWASDDALETVTVHTPTTFPPRRVFRNRHRRNKSKSQDEIPSLWGTIKRAYPSLPNKPLVFFGVIVCLISGAMTPLFSFVLSRLMAEVGVGAQAVSTIAFYAALVLVVALSDGIAAGTRFFVLDTAAMSWICSLRTKAFQLVLKQDKSWFDDPSHAAEKLVQALVKDADDSRTLVATVVAQGITAIAMLAVGLIWAMIRGWQLTLVGLAIGPIFAIFMMVQSVLMGKYELKNKRAREEVAKQYFDAVSNVRAIRSMAFESVFEKQFDEALEKALKSGVSGAMIAGTGYGVGNAMVYFSQAVLYYFGAVFMAKGTYSYLQLLEILNLVVFSVSIAAQMMAFIPKIAKSKQAYHDMSKYLTLSSESSETTGDKRFPIAGDLSFNNVSFTYPQRPEVPVLQDMSFTVKDGECVAIVGASGSGKSTVAALVQRFYEPASGHVSIGRFNLAESDVAWLRSHVAVVSQHAALFDASIRDNITYGSESIPFEEVQRAARDANLDKFIESLPQGYDTMLGENASLISGGQAQRLQIARALVNGKANILLLDEFTSALDVENQEAVMSTVMKIKEGRTTLIVTHKLPIMRRCDRILVVADGKVVEDGSYEALMARRGAFYTMASAGEWASD